MAWAILKLAQTSRKQELTRGVYCILTKPHLTKGSNAKINITTEFSSSFYPKIIYGGPCFENLKKTHLNFEFKFKLNLKQKKKHKRKEKEMEGGAAQSWWAGCGEAQPLLWP